MNIAKMKKILLTMGLCLFSTASVYAAASSLLGAEWYVPAEESTGKIALVEKSSGIARLGTVQMDGTVQWLLVPTGISDVSDVGSSGAGFNPHFLWITSPQSNRVAMLNFGFGLGTVRRLNAMQGIGPTGVTEGADSQSIVLASTLHGSPRSLLEIIDDVAFSPLVISSRSHSRVSLRLEPMTDPASRQKLTIHGYRNTSNVLSIALSEKDGTTLSDKHAVTLTGNLSFITDVVGTTGERMVVAFQPGSTVCHQVVLSQPLSVGSTHTLRSSAVMPFTVSALIPVPTSGAGPMSDGLIAIAADGSQAKWLRIDAAGNLLDQGHTFSPSSGNFLNGILPVSGIGVLAVEATSLGGRSSHFVSKQWNGSSWVDQDQGALPTLPSNGAGLSLASVLFYSSNPFTDENAQVLGSQSLPEWSSLSFYPDPFPSTVNQEAYGTALTGLQSVNTAPLSPPPWTNYVLTNQVQRDLSIMPLRGASAISGPDLTINPVSGDYTQALQVSALFQEEYYDLYYRSSPTAAWSLWSGPVGVGYSSDWQFYLRHKISGVAGEIVNRNYQFAASDFASFDSDQDGVPDYVEMAKGLNPFGGADSDGDGVSDLDEILAATNPRNAAEFPASPAGIPTGDGLAVAAMSFDATNAQAASGEFLAMHSLAGTLLSREPVVDPAAPIGGGVTRYASLQSHVGTSTSSLVLLSSSTFSEVVGGARNGREIIRLLPADHPAALVVAYTPTGTSLTGDANAWILAAQSAATTYQPVSDLTDLRPIDSALSILLEEMFHTSLSSLRPVSEPLAPLDEFSAFSSRSHDVGRNRLSQADIDLMSTSGYDFREALVIAQTAAVGMTNLVNAIYLHHVANYVEPVESGDPVLPLPIDALRLVLRGQPLPATYAGAATVAEISTAVAAYDAALDQADDAFRPVAQWTLEIPGAVERGVYVRTTDLQEVILLHANGERFYLDQGLGLAPGTRFVVGGYTDTAAQGSRPSMQVTSVVLASTPQASDRDTDGNLLDDEWELYFFGATGQDPQSEVNGSGYRLLQYFLDGIDPRGDDVPDGSAISAMPSEPVITPVVSGGYTMDFSFPDVYAERFVFGIEASATLQAGSFTAMAGLSATRIGENRYRFTIPSTSSTEPSKFFRATVKLR